MLRNVDAALLIRIAPQAPSQVAPWFTTSPSGRASLANPGGYVNAQVASLFNQALGQLNPVDATDTYGAIDRQIADDVATIPLVSLPMLQVWRTRLLGISVFPFGGTPTQGAARWAIMIPQVNGKQDGAEVPSRTVAN